MRASIWLSIVGLALASGCSVFDDDDDDDGSPPPGPGPDPSVGLDARPANATCLAPDLSGAPGGDVDVELVDAFPSLPDLSRPVALVQAPGDTSRWYVVEQGGTVRVFDNDPDATGFTTVIDLSAGVQCCGEAGLLGIAFDPDFTSNGHVYLSYTAPGLVSTVSRFTSNDGGATLDPGSEQVILRVNQDFTNHNGGNIAFGPDGYLYIGLGDGGGGGDPNSRAQNTTNLLGAMLRIDVHGGPPYGIPPNNPFAANPLCPADHSSASQCPEIYAWGLRNPWRWSFDRDTDALWVGDVGQNMWEEIDIVERNGNYGWDCREGAHAFGSPAPSCSTASGLIDPVFEYDHGDGVSVTGGYVYRGAAMPALEGRYVFADFASRFIWSLEPDGAGGYTREQIEQSSQGVASFAEDAAGELYVVGWSSGNDGRIQRLEPAGGGGQPPAEPVAAELSATGCVDASDPEAPAPGLIPYAPAAPFWSDGGTKERWLALPDGTSIAIGADGDFDLPEGSVLVKHFRLGDMLVETRLFMHHPGDGWAGYSYEWNTAQTEATLLAGGKVAQVAGQDWIFPSRAECLSCHTAAAGFTLGLETAQLNHAITYPSTGRTANQLATLDAIVLFDAPLGDPAVQPAVVDPYDTAAPLDARARAYLHTNCAQCHRAGGPAPSPLELSFDVALDDTNACDAPPQSGDLGLGAAARLIAPGAPDSSVLLERMSRRDDPAEMPPLASNLPDPAGVELIREWIGGLTGC